MTRDPKTEQGVEPKVGSYPTPRRGGTGTIVGVVIALVVVLLALWAFTDII